MTSTFINLFRIPEIRQKIMMTLGLLFVYRVGFQVPLPGINVEILKVFSEKSLGNPLFGIMNMLTGGGLDQCVLFSLGVMPYISASIIFSLLVKVIPSLEALSKEGAAGQRKINQYTRYSTIPICIIQSYFVIFGVLSKSFPEGPLVTGGLTFSYSLMAIVAFTAGTIFIMWLGEQITEHGVGNGISLIIMGGIIARLPTYIMDFLGRQAMNLDEKIKSLLLFILAWAITVYVIVLITKAQRRIPIQQAKLTRGRRVYGGQRHFLPIKVNSAGVMPIIFASALLVVPTLVGGFLKTYIPLFAGVEDAFRNAGWWYWTIYCALIFFFAFFWNSLMFQPKEIANNLKEYGSFIPGIRPGHRTAEYLGGVMTRLTLAGSAFLAAIAYLPNLITGSIDIPQGMAFFMGGTSILIVVGVALDMVDKLNAMLVMRNYDGFLKGDAGSSSWGRRKA